MKTNKIKSNFEAERRVKEESSAINQSRRPGFYILIPKKKYIPTPLHWKTFNFYPFFHAF